MFTATDLIIFCLGIAIGWLLKSLLGKSSRAAVDPAVANEGHQHDQARADNDVRQNSDVRDDRPAYFEIGSNKKRVLEVLGTPDEVREYGSAGAMWYYNQYDRCGVSFSGWGRVDNVSRPKAFGDKFRFRP